MDRDRRHDAPADEDPRGAGMGPELDPELDFDFVWADDVDDVDDADDEEREADGRRPDKEDGGRGSAIR